MAKLKVDSTLVTFTEIPDEITLCLNISNCPHHCKNCFEPWLREDRGEHLTLTKLQELAAAHPHISCICFMGGDANHEEIIHLCYAYHDYDPSVKFAMYSGDDDLDLGLMKVLTYYKIGHYDEEFGPLNVKTTNQRLYKKVNNRLVDITYKFQQEKR